jgi:hypothetical protein
MESLEGANVALLGWLEGREAMPDSGETQSIRDRFLVEKTELAPPPKFSWERYQPKLVFAQTEKPGTR